MTKSKILFLDHTPFVGGAQLALVRHLNLLDLERFDPVVVSSDPDFFSRSVKVERRPFVKVMRHSFGRLRILRPSSAASFIFSSFFLLLTTMRERPRIIVANTERCFYAAFLSVLVLRKPLVLFVRDFEFSKRLITLLRPWVSFYVCVSKAIRDYYFDADQKKVSVIYVGTDLGDQLRLVKESEIEDLRQKFNLREEFIIGFVGRLVDWKGPLILVDIAKILSDFGSNIPSWRIVVVGEGAGQAGNIEKELRQSITDQGLDGYFSLVGFSNELPVWYKIFSVLLHTSRKAEPFATVVVESLTSSVPVIAINLGGSKEVIVNGQNGFLVDYSAQAFVKAILGLMKDQGSYPRLSERARISASPFREADITGKIEDVYDRVLGGLK